MSILYFCPVLATPSGGVRVIYQHSELLERNGIPSQVVHPEDSSYRCRWFDSKTSIRRGSNVDPTGDFVVVPEVWAANGGKHFHQSGVSFAIFVQNGYLMRHGVGDLGRSELRAAYEHASLILSISEDTTKVITLKYPGIDKSKIVRLLPGIQPGFSPGVKEKIISFMPRKLREHSEVVTYLVADLLPPDWKIVPIDAVTENDVARLLARSSIFMSFCDQEGLGLPPLEAAFSGNLVVGYTGQGANEYFAEPVFRRIENGDFIAFTRAVLQSIEDVEKGILRDPGLVHQTEQLRNDYSLNAAVGPLLAFGRRAESCRSGGARSTTA